MLQRFSVGNLWLSVFLCHQKMKMEWKCGILLLEWACELKKIKLVFLLSWKPLRRHTSPSWEVRNERWHRQCLHWIICFFLFLNSCVLLFVCLLLFNLHCLLLRLLRRQKPTWPGWRRTTSQYGAGWRNRTRWTNEGKIHASKLLVCLHVFFW